MSVTVAKKFYLLYLKPSNFCEMCYLIVNFAVVLDALHRHHESQKKSNTCDSFTLMNRFSAMSPVRSVQVTYRIGD
jgi:hypothetical protein